MKKINILLKELSGCTHAHTHSSTWRLLKSLNYASLPFKCAWSAQSKIKIAWCFKTLQLKTIFADTMNVKPFNGLSQKTTDQHPYKKRAIIKGSM